MKGLSKGFFEKSRKQSVVEPKEKEKIIPFNWSEQVLKGEKKVIMTLATEKNNEKKIL